MQAHTLLTKVRVIHQRGVDLLKAKKFRENEKISITIDKTIDDIEAFADIIQKNAPFPYPDSFRDSERESNILQDLAHIYDEIAEDPDKLRGVENIRNALNGLSVELGNSGTLAFNWHPLLAFTQARFEEIAEIYERLLERLKQTESIGTLLVTKTKIVHRMAKTCREGLEKLGYHDQMVARVEPLSSDTTGVHDFSTWTADRFTT